jgi:hypothetical protein
MAKQPNILILWGDDIGTWNISHFSRGMRGYTTRISTASPRSSARTSYRESSLTGEFRCTSELRLLPRRTQCLTLL